MALNFGAALESGEGQEKIVDAIYEKPTEVITVGGGFDLAVIKPDFEDFRTKAITIYKDAGELTVSDDATLQKAVALGGAAKKIAKMVDDQVDTATADAKEFINVVRGIGNTITDLLITKRNSRKEITNFGSVEQVLKEKIAQHQAKIELERREQERKAREAAAELQRKLDAEAAEANRKALEEARQRAEIEARIKREREEAEARERQRIAEEEARKRKATEKEMVTLRAKEELERKEREARAETERLEAIRKAEEETIKNAVLAPTVLAPVIPEEAKIVRTESGASSFQSTRWVCRIVDGALVPRQYCVPLQQLLNDAVKAGVREIAGCVIEPETSVKFRS